MPKNPRVVWADDPPHLKAAFSKLGLSEIAGPEHEPQVLAMYAACGHPEIKRDEVAWCAAYVGWCLVQARLLTSRPIKENLLASSYLRYPGFKFTKFDTIPRGAICVWPRDAGSGHVNFNLADLGDRLLLIGGNQSNGRGGGVTITTASKDSLRSAVMPIYPAESVPLPRPKPPVVEEEEPPAPPDPPVRPPREEEPEPAPPPAVPVNAPWYRRIWFWITGGGGVTGMGALAWITDPWAWAKLIAVLVVCLMALSVFAFLGAWALFGIKATREYVRSWLPRKGTRQ